VATRTVKVWFDPAGDFLEVLLDPARPGYFRETAYDRVLEKVGEDGMLLGFSILGVSRLRTDAPLEVELPVSET
jgi:hypothetical protein